MNASLDKMLQDVEWGKYKMDDLFQKIKTKKLHYKANNLPKEPEGEYVLPCLTSSFQNQGLNYYVPRDGATILKNVISIPSNSDVYRAYFQPNEFTVLSDAYAISWKYSNTCPSQNQYLFMVMCINKVTNLPIYSYKNKLGGWNVVKKKHILLPKRNGTIDFEFMENFIAELEAQRIVELEAYLKASGLSDYRLTPKEKALSSQKVIYKMFRVRDLFYLITNPQLDKSYFEFREEAQYPYFTRTENNNGILGYVNYLDEKHKIKGNSLAVGMISMKFHYMEHDFYAGQFTKTAYAKFDKFNRRIAEYFISLLNCHSKIYNGVLVRDFSQAFYDTELILPVTSNNELDYDYMETYISIQEKAVISGVVDFADWKIEATEAVVNELAT